MLNRIHSTQVTDFQNTDLVERQSNPEVEAAAVAASSALEENKQQLQGKLRELQDKKHKMDSLLQELNSLRDQRSEVMIQLNNASANNAQGTIKPSFVQLKGLSNTSNMISKNKGKLFKSVQFRFLQLYLTLFFRS